MAGGEMKWNGKGKYGLFEGADYQAVL